MYLYLLVIQQFIYTLNYQVVMPMFVQFSELSTWKLMDANQNIITQSHFKSQICWFTFQTFGL